MLWTPHRPARPEKSEGGRRFQLVSDYDAAGDQPAAIAELVAGVQAREHDQVLLGVTGSGKTFTMAKIIEQTQRPALILAHNKTLAAQLYSEFKSFFPENAVEYFVSYYDYYQPEAYVASRDLYIEKDSSVNAEIDRLRHAATAAVFARRDVIVVASVSCIYGLGSPDVYERNMQLLRRGESVDRDGLLHKLVAIQYTRNDAVLARGNFRVKGETLEVFPAYAETAYRAVFDRLGRRPGLLYDPFFLEGVATVPDLNQPDHLHPTAEGVRRIVARLLPLVEKLLAEVPPA